MLLPTFNTPAENRSSGGSLSLQMEAFERQVLERALVECGGRINDVMARLDVPRRTLNEKMARFGLERQKFVDTERSE